MVKVSALPEATTLGNTDEFYVNVSGTSKRTKFATMRAVVKPFVDVIDHIAEDTPAEAEALADLIALGGHIRLPAGTWWIDGVTHPLIPPAESTIELAAGANLRVIATDHDAHYEAIQINHPNISIFGPGNIIGDLEDHTGITGEFGWGIWIREGGDDFVIDGVNVSRCWGDGILWGDSPGLGIQTGGRISRCRVFDNRRNNISVIKNIGGVLEDTDLDDCQLLAQSLGLATNPGVGIDFEPDNGSASNKIVDFTMRNVRARRNRNGGFVIQAPYNAAWGDGGTAGPVNVYAYNCQAEDNGYAGLTIANDIGNGWWIGEGGILEAFSCTSVRNKRAGWHVEASGGGRTGEGVLTAHSCTAIDNSTAGFEINTGGNTLINSVAESNGSVAPDDDWDNIVIWEGVGNRVIGGSSKPDAAGVQTVFNVTVRSGATDTVVTGHVATDAGISGIYYDSGTTTVDTGNIGF